MTMTSQVATSFDATDRGRLLAEMVREHLPLAKRLAHRYRYAGQPLDDLIQVASIGLLKAIDRFDPGRGVAFSSFAVPTILGELKRYHRDFGWSIRVPRQQQDHSLRIKDAVPELAQTLRRSPTVAELARYAELTEEQVREAMLTQGVYAALSIDAPIDNDARAAVREPSELPDLELSDEWVDVAPLLRALPHRERKIIVLRFFMDWTQSQIAAEFGISQMHVSRLLSRTMKALREAVAARDD